MTEYRPFLNTDPPRIVEIWRSQHPRRELLPAVSPDVLERFVFAKPYFDRLGLIMAIDGHDPLGFVHAGFGADEDRQRLDRRQGVISMLQVTSNEKKDEIGAELLVRGEQYLAERGAEQVVSAGHPGADPFYQGLSGGSQVSGIANSDEWTTRMFSTNGYVSDQRHIILQRNLVGFRPRVDRQQMQIRRQYNIEARLDPPVRSWWEACTFGEANRMQFTLTSKRGELAGRVTFWDIEPLGGGWGVQASGIQELEMVGPDDTTDIACHLLGESMRQLQSHGVNMVEVHCRHDDQPRLDLFRQLNFEVRDETTVWRKPSST